MFDRLARAIWCLFLCLALTMTAWAEASDSDAMPDIFGAATYDISKFCSKRATRDTILYLDVDALRGSEREWARSVIGKLKASSVPGERLSIVVLDSDTWSAAEVLSTCWPDYSAAERRQLRDNGPYIFTEDPLLFLATQRKVWEQKVASSISKAIRRANNKSVTRGPSVIRALVSDQDRLSRSAAATRIILYSTLRESGDLITEQLPKTDKATEDFARKLVKESLRYDFGHSAVYILTPRDLVNTKDQDALRMFWEHFVRQCSGQLQSFGQNLLVPGTVPVGSVFYDLNVDIDGLPRKGLMRLLYDTDGELQDSYIYFTNSASSKLEGTFRCDRSSCLLDGRVSMPVLTQTRGEAISLKGGDAKRLVGTLGKLNPRERSGELRKPELRGKADSAEREIIAMLRQ